MTLIISYDFILRYRKILTPDILTPPIKSMRVFAIPIPPAIAPNIPSAGSGERVMLAASPANSRRSTLIVPQKSCLREEND